MTDFFFLLSLILINIIFLIKFEYISKLIGIFDIPDNKRKIHNRKISCIGGMLIFLNITYLFFYNFFLGGELISKILFEIEPTTHLYFYVALFMIFFMGLLDDIYELNPFLKIFILTLIVLFITTFDQSLRINYLRFSFIDEVYNLSGFSIFFSFFCILVFMNAFNMYDGTNLQVSSISIIIFFYLLFLLNEKDYFLITLIASLMIFSYLNNKNRLFLGDNGSLILSFIIGYLFIKFYNKELIYYVENVCLFLILPVLDLLRLFIIRIFNKKNPFRPDQNHIHHILMKKFSYGFTKLILFCIYAVPIFLGIITEKYLIFIIIQIITYSTIFIFKKEKSKHVK